MNSQSSADVGVPGAGNGHWAVATQGEPAVAGQSMRELSASYWYPVYAWWRRVGCNAAKATYATEACFSRWIEREPPRRDQAGAVRMRDWLLKRLPEMAVAGVKPWPAPLITIDRKWAEEIYPTEPEGAAGDILARRLALELLEFAIETLHKEDVAAGRGDEFKRLLPRLRIVAGERCEPAVEDFRQRFGATLRVLVADIIADPREVNGEIATLTGAAINPSGPVPAIFGSLTPDELFAWALAARAALPKPAAPVRVAAAVAAAAHPVAQPVLVKPVSQAAGPASPRRNVRWIAIAAGVPVAALVAFFATRPEGDTLSIAEKAALAQANQPKPATTATTANKPAPTAKPKPARPGPKKVTPTPEPAAAPSAPAPAVVATAPAPMAPPVPEPAPPPAAPPQSESAKWLADKLAEMEAAYEREVRAPFDAGTAKALQQYVSVVDAGISAAEAAGKRDAVLALRGERQRIMSGQAALADDSAGSIPELKPLRTQWRTQFAKLDKERHDRAKALHARFDPVLAQQETRLVQQGNAGDAAILKEKRAEIAAAWLVPPVGMPASETAPARSIPASTGRLAPHALVARLLALHARVMVRDAPGRTARAVETTLDLKGDKFEISEVEFRARPENGAPVTDADLAILEQLPTVGNLVINGVAVTDETLAGLRACRGVQNLRLENLQNITAGGLAVLDSLPELQSLALVNLPLGDEAIATVAQLSKLRKLRINNLPITDASLAAITSITALEDLEFGGGKVKVASASWEHVAAMRRLTRLHCKVSEVNPVITGHIVRCRHLTNLKLDGSGVTDDAIAPLAAHSHLTALDLTGTKVTGAGFKSWPVRPAMTSVKLKDCPGLDDTVLRAITKAFPKLETLEVSGAPGAITTAGAAELTRLRSLAALRLFGDAANDAILSELPGLDNLTNLSLGKAKITDSGLAALVKLPRLERIAITNPPITDSALKALRKFRALKEITVGQETQEAIFTRLRSDLPGITIRR